MKKFLKVLLIAFFGVFVLVLGIGFLTPEKMEIKRTVYIDAPEYIVRDYLIDLKKMREWSPWAGLDSSMNYSFEGTMGEERSKYYWNGNDKVGEGYLVLTSIEEDSIRTKLTFIRPWEGESHAWYVLESASDLGEEVETEVTWGYNGENDFSGRIFTFLFNVENKLEEDYDKGLAKLKILAESKANELAGQDYEIPEVREVVLPEKLYLARRNMVNMVESKDYIDQRTEEVQKKYINNKLSSATTKTGIFYEFNEEEGLVDVAAAVPVEAEMDVEDYKIIKMDSARVLKIIHHGSYETINSAYISLMNYQNLRGYKTKGISMEEYLVDNTTEKDTSKWETAVYMYLE